MSTKKYPVYELQLDLHDDTIHTSMRVFDSQSFTLLYGVVRARMFGKLSSTRLCLSLCDEGDTAAWGHTWRPEWEIPLAVRPSGAPDDSPLYVPVSYLVLGCIYHGYDPSKALSYLDRKVERIEVPYRGQLFAVRKDLIEG